MQGIESERQTEATLQVIHRFNEAFNRHDVDAVMSMMSDDCVFESTYPPDGQRLEGQIAVREAWNDLFRSSPDALFESEEIFACADRCVVRWIYRFTDGRGEASHVRGIDAFRVRNNKVTEKLSYVKG